LNGNGNKFSLDYLEEHHQISEDDVENLYKFAKFTYERGAYNDAALYLKIYRLLSNNEGNKISALWGKCSVEIIAENWNDALTDINQIKEFIDNPYGILNARQQLHQRKWLLNWSLFVFFNHPNGLSPLLDLYLSENRYKQVIQNGCPWILRYLVAAVLTSRPSDEIIRETLKMVVQEEYQYSDPLTRFLQSLYVDFNFDESENHLKDIEELLEEDYFLHPLKQIISTNAKNLIYENYCLVHCKIDLSTLTEKLGKTEDETIDFINHVLEKSKMKATVHRDKSIIQIDRKVSSKLDALSMILGKNNIE